jgi:hypothetical protein
MTKPASEIPDLLVPKKRATTSRTQPVAEPAADFAPPESRASHLASTAVEAVGYPQSMSKFRGAPPSMRDVPQSLDGHVLDEMDLFDNDAAGSLELDHARNAPAAVARTVARAPVTSAILVPEPAVPRGPSPAELVANYESPPAQIWMLPPYAVKVLARQFELKRKIDELRAQNSPELKLYEDALRTYDTSAFSKGVAMSCAAIFLALLILFSPVIVRFIRLAGD